MTIREATVYDYPQIAELRSAYFDRLGRAEYEEIPGATWLVCVTEERVLACASYMDNTATIREIRDFYRAEGMDGLRGFSTLLRQVERMCDEAGKDMVFTTDPRNDRHIWSALRHHFDLVGLVFHRPPKSISKREQV